MHLQARIVVILATTLAVAAIAAARNEGLPPSAPDSLAAAEACATASSLELPQPAAFAVAAVDSTADALAAAAANQRTEVEVGPIARRLLRSDADRIRDRAAALATKLGLSAADSEALLAVLLEEQTRRAAALAERRRKPDDAEIDARVRAEFDAILTWKTKALADQFGAERANLMLKRR